MEKQLGLPMKCKFFTVFSAAILFTIAAVFANPIYVSKTGNDANDGLSWETANYYYSENSGLLWFRTSSLDTGSPLYSFCNSYIYNNTLIGAKLQIISRYYGAHHSSKTNEVLIANNTICNNHLVNSTNALVFVSDEISNFTLANNIFFGNTNSVTGESSPLVYVANPNPTIRIVNNFTNDPHFLTGTLIPQSILADFGGPRNLGETNDLSIIGSVDALGRPRVNARLGNIPDAGAIEYYPPQYRRERFRIMINRSK